LLGTVTRPVKPVEAAAEWVERTAGSTSATLSKRVVSDTSALANVSAAARPAAPPSVTSACPGIALHASAVAPAPHAVRGAAPRARAVSL
jgi:hypothetical protein